MTLFQDVSFFICLFLLLIPAFVLGITGRKRDMYVLAASVVFDALAIGRDPFHMVFFLVYLLWETLTVFSYRKIRIRGGRKGKVYAVFLILSLLPLVISKVSGFLPVHLFQILGISYLTFKSAQVVIEIYDGVIKDEMTILDFLSFLVFFPGILSGPIDRSRRYLGDLHQKYSRKEYLEIAGDGLEKLMLGLVYKFVLAAICYQGVQFFADSYGFLAQVGYAYTYGVYMFFDFAGYSLMAIGTSCLFGIRTPENFRKPFLSHDMKEFWDRWHMTLSYWFRDFVFTRFVMQSMRHKWFKDKLQTACAGFLVDMFVMGIWHGLTPYYLLYGLYHGILLALNEVYQKKSGFYRKNKKKQWYRLVSWAVTMQLVMFGFLLFSGHLFPAG